MPLSSNNKKIRVAMLGTGHAHALGKVQALRSLPEYEFTGICRPDSDEPNEGEGFRGVRWLSLEEVLQDASIELVDVESRVQRNLQYARVFCSPYLSKLCATLCEVRVVQAEMVQDIKRLEPHPQGMPLVDLELPDKSRIESKEARPL